MAKTKINQAQVQRVCQIDGVAQRTGEKFVKAGYVSAQDIADIPVTPANNLRENSKKLGIRKDRLLLAVTNAQKLVDKINGSAEQVGNEIVKVNGAGAPETSTDETVLEDKSSEESQSEAAAEESSSDIKDALSNQVQNSVEDLNTLVDMLEGTDKMLTELNEFSASVQAKSNENEASLSDVQSAFESEDGSFNEQDGSSNELDSSSNEPDQVAAESGSFNEQDGSSNELDSSSNEPKKIIMLPEVELDIAFENPRIRDMPRGEEPLLLESIKKDGIQEALLVYPVEEKRADGIKYMVLNGGTRLECARRLGITEVPCVIKSHLTPEERIRLAFTLNETQTPYTHLERARSTLNLKIETGLPNEGLGEFMGLKKVQIGKYIRVNINPPVILESLHNGETTLDEGVEYSKLAFDVEYDPESKGFTWNKEPEYWKDQRTKHQISLFETVKSGMMNLRQLRTSVNQIVSQEQKSREEKVRAEKEAQERAKKEKDALNRDISKNRYLVKQKQEDLDASVTGVMELSKRFKDEISDIPEELYSKVLLVDSEDYKKYLTMGSLDFHVAFKPLMPKDPAPLRMAMKRLKDDHTHEFFTFKGEKYCLCCANVVSEEDKQRATLIGDIQAEIDKNEQQSSYIDAFREEFWTKTDAIKSNYTALRRYEADLASLEEKQANLQNEDSGESDHSKSEIETNISLGNKPLNENTLKDAPVVSVCIYCNTKIEKGENYAEYYVTNAGTPTSYHVHSTCAEKIDTEGFDFTKAAADLCPLCNYKVIKDPKKSGYVAYGPVGIAIDDNEEIIRNVHSDCLDHFCVSSQCPACNEPNRDNNDVFLTKENGEINIYHEGCYKALKSEVHSE